MALSYLSSFIFVVTLHTGLSVQIAIDHVCIAQEIKISQGLLFFFFCLRVVVMYTKPLRHLYPPASPSGVVPQCQSFCTSTAISVSSDSVDVPVPLH
jgi:hypothetical protein